MLKLRPAFSSDGLKSLSLKVIKILLNFRFLCCGTHVKGLSNSFLPIQRTSILLMRSRPRLVLSLMMIASFFDSPAFAWGERGHDLIARVAARLVAQRSKDPALFVPFAAKEHMLGHLANIPDIHFRDLPEGKSLEGPTHYFDSEYLFATPSLQGFPVSIAEAAKLSEAHGKNLYSEVGTAPWRIAQLFDLYVGALKSAKSPDPSKALGKAEIEEAVNRALVYAGVMAHYVGDLAQPLHTTVDYDGWKKDQGGIHSYFEEAIVNAFPLSLDYEVFAAASREHPQTKIWTSLPASQRISAGRNPVLVAAALIADSHEDLNKLFKLDKSVCVIKPSRSEPIKIPAERKPAAQVAESFRPMVIDRLATGADALSHLWQVGWELAGKPDLSQYKSYAYQLAPAYIAPDYIPAAPTPLPK